MAPLTLELLYVGDRMGRTSVGLFPDPSKPELLSDEFLDLLRLLG